MGDRANIKIKQATGDVWFYTHWSGHRLPEILRTALARRVRWGDSPYLARIIFCEMIKGGEAGFGISTTVQDNEYPVLVCDTNTMTVFIETESGNDDLEYPTRFGFQDYASQSEASWGIFK